MFAAFFASAMSNPVTLIIFISALVIVLGLIIANVKVVPQSQSFVIERFGTYHDTWMAGLHVKVPILDRIAKQVSLKEQVADFPPQPVITKDNVTMQIDTIVFYQITDSKLFTYGVEYPLSAIENLTATTLRNIIGELELDQTLTSRDTINSQIRSILDEATDPWGIKVNRVELRNIVPPREIQEAMEKQMKAERERRESILRAEGDKASRVLVAEGMKESQILQAEGDKQAAILRAEANREARIREAEGEALAIKSVQKANADAIEYINAAKPGEGYLMLQKLIAMAKIADGQATKLIVPSDLQGVAGLVSAVKEAL